MWTEAADLKQLMEQLAEAGVAMMIRVDVERFNEGKPHWTLLLSGPTLHPNNTIHVEARSLEVCITSGLRRLREHDGEWHWLGDWV
ncbi:hypothetical protein ACFXPR_24130 [Nocardia tengchongensis]|uniref:hypothetical protein n=1 Tax=Nocardia tengchongensis TaxID=2055889 RepID=UPI0036C76AD3